MAGQLTTVQVTAFGVGLRVTTDQRLAPSVLRRLPPGSVGDGQATTSRSYAIEPDPGETYRPLRFRLLVDGEVTERDRSEQEVLRDLETDMRHHAAEYAPEHVFVHAGSVAFGDFGIVIPGRSYSGKSTLVAALVAAGAEYLSDEFAVFDADGRLHPFDKPLSLRNANGEQVDHSVEGVGGTKGLVPVTLRAVLSAPFAAEVESWAPTALSSGESVLALLDNALAARRFPERCLDVLSRAVQTAVSLRGPRPEADVAARDILRRVVAKCV